MSNIKIEGAHVNAAQMNLLNHAAKKPSIELCANYLRAAFPGYSVEQGHTWLKLVVQSNTKQTTERGPAKLRP